MKAHYQLETHKHPHLELMELLWLSLSESCDDSPGLEYIGGGG